MLVALLVLLIIYLVKISINRQKELEQDINHLVNIKRSGKTNQIIKDCSKIHLLNFVDWK